MISIATNLKMESVLNVLRDTTLIVKESVHWQTLAVELLMRLTETVLPAILDSKFKMEDAGSKLPLRDAKLIKMAFVKNVPKDTTSTG